MYKYKREITSKDSLKYSSFLISSNDTICSLAGNFGAYRIYDGLYIKNSKVLVENLFEEIEVKNTIYKIANITTSSTDISSDDYIEYVNLDENYIKYNLELINYTKKIAFDIENDLLVINYKVQNNQNNSIKFRVNPLITDRGLTNVKNSQLLKFTQRKAKNGVVINLSVHDNRNLYISSDILKYDKDIEYINNVKHYSTDEELNDSVYVEDLFIPGVFEITIKKNETKEFNILISTNEIRQNISIEKYFEKRNEILDKIPEKYVELRDLALGISAFDDKKISTFPYVFKLSDIYRENEITLDKLLKYINVLEEYTRAIEGRYLVFDKRKEAEEELKYVNGIIDDLDRLNIENKKFIFTFSKLKLWYIEIQNKLIGDNNCLITEARVSFVRNVINDLMGPGKQDIILKNIETASLMFNAIKICKYMLNKIGEDDEYLYEMEDNVKDLIENEFFVEDKKCMKRNLDDDFVKSNIPMIYTLSLSYPCIVGQKSIMLLDTVFKELYTPYGLRTTFKGDLNNKGGIYPKYLAHFIKANLRQNGVTSASKKIAYNLVKELIMDISKKVSGGVPLVYNEKGIRVNNISYDLLTNAEVIRLYDMLT